MGQDKVDYTSSVEVKQHTTTYKHFKTFNSVHEFERHWKLLELHYWLYLL